MISVINITDGCDFVNRVFKKIKKFFVCNPPPLALCVSKLCGRQMAAPTISTVINQTKGAVSKKAGFYVWQKGFYDHVIRSEQDYLDIWNYIEGNPSKWAEDKLFASDSR